MASLIQETWAAIDEQDGFDEFESFEIDDTLLMSILDEPHAEDECDAERLSSVIQSLEAEINPIVIEEHDMSLELELNGEWGGCHHLSMNQNMLKSQDFDYNWMEMEDMYIQGQGYEDGMGGIIEFGGVKDYSQISYGNYMEEHGYGALWQETN